MAGETICGSATIKLGDQIRASWGIGSRISLVVIVVLVLIICALQTSPPFDGAFGIGLYVFSVVVVSTIVVLLWLLLRTVLVTILFLVRMGRAQRDMSYEIGSDSIMVRDRTGTTLTTPWTVARRARETKRAFRFELQVGTRYIPRRAFAETDIAALRALVREKLGERAELRLG